MGLRLKLLMGSEEIAIWEEDGERKWIAQDEDDAFILNGMTLSVTAAAPMKAKALEIAERIGARLVIEGKERRRHRKGVVY